MDNVLKYKDSYVSQALPVPAGTTAGNIVPLGNQGLLGIAKVDRATTDGISKGLCAQGLKDGEATVELVGCTRILALDIVSAGAQFAKVYRLTNGTYSCTSASGAITIGYLLNTLAAAGKGRVAISPVIATVAA